MLLATTFEILVISAAVKLNGKSYMTAVAIGIKYALKYPSKRPRPTNISPVKS